MLTEARQLRERLVVDSSEASKKLSEAVLHAALCAEEVESANRQLALADMCIGQIRSLMRAHGHPIHLPSTRSDTVTVPSINGNATQGSFFICEARMRSHDVLDDPAEPA